MLMWNIGVLPNRTGNWKARDQRPSTGESLCLGEDGIPGVEGS